MERPPTTMCTYIVFCSLFTLPFCLQPSEKSVGIFMDFLKFLKKYPLKSEILGSMDKTGYGKLPCLNGYAQIFSTKSHGPRNRHICESLAVFDSLTFLETYPRKSEMRPNGFIRKSNGHLKSH